MGDALIVRKGGSENLSAELSAQDTVITNITESLVGRATGADATAEDIWVGKKAYVGQTLITGTYDPSYYGEMISFMAIPAKTDSGGTTGSVRFKAEKPADATGYDIRYKTSAWVNTDTHESGTLVQACDQDYIGTNVWLEVSGLPLNQDLYFAAFPKRNNAYNNAIGTTNVTRSRSGGLVVEYTFDSITGTTINDTSGNGNNGTLHGTTTQIGQVGNESLCSVAGGASSSFSIAMPSAVSSVDFTSLTTSLFIKNNEGNSVGDFRHPLYLAFNGTHTTVNIQFRVSSDYSKWCYAASGSYPTPRSISELSNRTFICGRQNGSACSLRVGSETPVTFTAGSYTENSGNFLFNHSSSAQSRSFKGSIDQFRLYNRELEDYEVDNIYNGGAGC